MNLVQLGQLEQMDNQDPPDQWDPLAQEQEREENRDQQEIQDQQVQMALLDHPVHLDSQVWQVHRDQPVTLVSRAMMDFKVGLDQQVNRGTLAQQDQREIQETLAQLVL